MKNFLVKKRTKEKIRALENVRALLLLTFYLSTRFWALANLSCFLIRLAKKLT